MTTVSTPPSSSSNRSYSSYCGILALLLPHSHRKLVTDEQIENIESYYLTHYKNCDLEGILFNTGKQNEADTPETHSHPQDIRTSVDLEQNKLVHTRSSLHTEEALYQPLHSEFTLFYFCDSTCRYSIRFSYQLVRFIHLSYSSEITPGHSHSMHPLTPCELGNFTIGTNIARNNQIKTLQLVCIPNDVSYPSRLYDGPFHRTEFWHMGYRHTNRLALIRLLAITRVPTLVVINNKTGRVVTEHGITLIDKHFDSHRECEAILNEWRKGKSGITNLSWIMSNCTIG